MARWSNLGWLYWTVTLGLLVLGLAGWQAGIPLAVALTAVQARHFALKTGSWSHLLVQVRVVYLGLLILGLWTPFWFVHWMQLAGTSARVLAGYCLLARLLSLLPWNRVEPFTVALLQRTLFMVRAEDHLGYRYGCGSLR
jgi:hypothetical protein